MGADTAGLIYRAQRAIDGTHPEHDFPVHDGGERAMPYLLLALVREQQEATARLAGIEAGLVRIAEALEQRPEPAPEPKRRLWLAGGR